MVKTVEISRRARKDLVTVPLHVRQKLLRWVDDVEESGLHEVQKRPGFHDEPLQGRRQGQRSIRLSKAYRAIYRIVKGAIEFVEILEVTKHVY